MLNAILTHNKQAFDKEAAAFVQHHPYIAFSALFIGLPVAVLTLVSICATIALLPIA